MKLKMRMIATFILITSSMLIANTLGLSDNGDGTWNVNYSSDGDMAGFQFNVDDASVLSVSGGAAEAAGFMISSSATTVLGFTVWGYHSGR
jgi:hypothetical protein